MFLNDVSLFLSENVLDKWYIVMICEQTFEVFWSYVMVVAIQLGETQVMVIVTAPTLLDNGILYFVFGESIICIFEQFDVLNIETNKLGFDLIGSVVLAI